MFAVGFAASRLKVIKEDTLPALAQIITKILLPCMIFYSTYANCKRETIIGNWEMVLLAALFYAVISLLMFVIAKLMRIEHDKDRVFQLCFIFGNTGFVGVPLLAAVFPDAGLVYMMMFSIVDQVVFWTYGIWLSTKRATTTGMCMLYLGALASFSRVLPVLKRPELYVGIVVKMIVLPVVVGHLIAITEIFPGQMVLALAIIMALPVMTVVPMVVANNGKEYEYATGITVVTLVASIVTIPLVVFLVGL